MGKNECRTMNLQLTENSLGFLKLSLVHICDGSDAVVIAIEIVRELRQSVNQHDVNRTQISLPGGFHGCIEMFTMAEDVHDSRALVLLFLMFILRAI